jgi:hypothetical protein
MGQGMNMLFRYELKKLLLAPAIIVFVALCLIVNAAIAIANYSDYEYQPDAKPANVFEGYQASDLAEGYIKKYGVTENNADNIRAKYEKLQPVIDEKSANGDALSPYFRELTYERHGLLFGTMFTAILAEICLLALLLALLSVTYENSRNTEQLVFSSKTGRRVMRVKLAASLTATIATSAVIIEGSLFVFFAGFDLLRYESAGSVRVPHIGEGGLAQSAPSWREVWSENVSSGFNFTIGEFGKPFITWHSFTVIEYLWATIGAAFLLAVCFCLLGYAVGVSARSDYGAAIAAVAVVAAMGFAEPLFPVGSMVKNALNLSPVGLWRNCGTWFTDGGANVLWANFESVGLAASLTALSLAALLISRAFKGREIL